MRIQTRISSAVLLLYSLGGLSRAGATVPEAVQDKLGALILLEVPVYRPHDATNSFDISTSSAREQTRRVIQARSNKNDLRWQLEQLQICIDRKFKRCRIYMGWVPATGVFVRSQKSNKIVLATPFHNFFTYLSLAFSDNGEDPSALNDFPMYFDFQLANGNYGTSPSRSKLDFYFRNRDYLITVESNHRLLESGHLGFYNSLLTKDYIEIDTLGNLASTFVTYASRLPSLNEAVYALRFKEQSGAFKAQVEPAALENLEDARFDIFWNPPSVKKFLVATQGRCYKGTTGSPLLNSRGEMIAIQQGELTHPGGGHTCLWLKTPIQF